MKNHGNVTRGYGILETYLADKRARQADQLIQLANRAGSILDIGCGSFPHFLSSILFHEKHGIDQLHDSKSKYNMDLSINIAHCKFEMDNNIPYKDNQFNVVTMLAVIEHIEPEQRLMLFKEIFRVLKPAGQMILTTPAAWTGWILNTLARCHLVSRAEIEEHKGPLRFITAERLLQQAGFTSESIHHGYFEGRMNLWITATKY